VSYLDESDLDEQHERRRLAETYSGMTDAELQNLARRPESLTEVAWEVLDDELDRRDLELLEEEAPEDREELELRELVTIRQFRDLPGRYWQRVVWSRRVLNVFWPTRTWSGWTGSFRTSSAESN
jgi:hypothetical protein